ncbi:Protein translocase subunit SecE [Chlamydiales bacterium STE3]|nr:Protein translocase subunit SecE [Chlamydiales bacterium STE3]
MELKKNGQISRVVSEKTKKKYRLRDFIEEIKLELKNINWTSREELKTYTQIVVSATFVFGMGVYLVDLAIQATLNMLTWFTHLIFG